MSKGFTITGVQKGSPADRAGIKVNDCLLKINNSYFFDLLDYCYLCAGEDVHLTIQSEGVLVESRIRKGYDEGIGLEFSSPTIGPLRRCQNKCIFCFIDQQPAGMRPSLYEKDDDYRLSFFYGNFITLTNAGNLDLKRIIRRGLSPMYISIHSTDPAIRCRMMRNRAAGRIWSQLKLLAGEGVEMHGQIVVCPGVNDGVHLERTVKDLSLLYPSFKSIALVPVGLTRYRRGLTLLRSITPGEAAQIVERYTQMQERFAERWGTPFVYLADEFYQLAGCPLPLDVHYGMYEQVGNGVGLGRLFLNELEEWKKQKIISLHCKTEISLVTGPSGGPFLKLLQAELKRIQGLEVYLHILSHNFWGGNVAVTGLLTGSDLLSGLKQQKLGEVVFIPAVMLKEGTDLFLDDISLPYLRSKLKVEVKAVKRLEEIRSYLLARDRAKSIPGKSKRRGVY